MVLPCPDISEEPREVPSASLRFSLTLPSASLGEQKPKDQLAAGNLERLGSNMMLATIMNSIHLKPTTWFRISTEGAPLLIVQPQKMNSWIINQIQWQWTPLPIHWMCIPIRRSIPYPPTLPSLGRGRAAPGTTVGVELCLRTSTKATPIASSNAATWSRHAEDSN